MNNPAVLSLYSNCNSKTLALLSHHLLTAGMLYAFEHIKVFLVRTSNSLDVPTSVVLSLHRTENVDIYLSLLHLGPLFTLTIRHLTKGGRILNHIHNYCKDFKIQILPIANLNVAELFIYYSIWLLVLHFSFWSCVIVFTFSCLNVCMLMMVLLLLKLWTWNLEKWSESNRINLFSQITDHDFLEASFLHNLSVFYPSLKCAVLNSPFLAIGFIQIKTSWLS